MAVAVGDYNRDGKVDLFTTTFSDDYKTLYRNDGGGNFTDVTYQAGLGEPTVPFLAWGAGFLDFDNDGLPDLFIANGHVYPEVDKQDWGTTWAERPQLFRNLDGAKFKEVPPATGSGLADVIPPEAQPSEIYLMTAISMWSSTTSIPFRRCFATWSRTKING